MFVYFGKQHGLVLMYQTLREDLHLNNQLLSANSGHVSWRVFKVLPVTGSLFWFVLTGRHLLNSTSQFSNSVQCIPTGFSLNGIRSNLGLAAATPVDVIGRVIPTRCVFSFILKKFLSRHIYLNRLSSILFLLSWLFVLRTFKI